MHERNIIRIICLEGTLYACTSREAHCTHYKQPILVVQHDEIHIQYMYMWQCAGHFGGTSCRLLKQDILVCQIRTFCIKVEEKLNCVALTLNLLFFCFNVHVQMLN